MYKNSPNLSMCQCVTLACLLEASAAKVGNVHRAADFEEMTFIDFVVSASVIGPVMEDTLQHGPGRTAYEAVKVTRQAVGKNTNLGTILLLAPLACVPLDITIEEGIGEVVMDFNADDARWIYEAIRLAKPGGMGQQQENDIKQKPPEDIMIAMQQAADRDLIAREYVELFPLCLKIVPQFLLQSLQVGLSISSAIVHTQMLLMAEYPDSLIARKCGDVVAKEASLRATGVIDSAAPMSETYCQALADFDFWARSDGHRRNPGTTADLIAAGLFVTLREGMLALPLPQVDKL